jgi:hypothetical protein
MRLSQFMPTMVSPPAKTVKPSRRFGVHPSVLSLLLAPDGASSRSALQLALPPGALGGFPARLDLPDALQVVLPGRRGPHRPKDSAARGRRQAG